jgi:AraC-like DNA-binding protein
MAKQTGRRSSESSELKNIKGDTVPFRQVMESFGKSLAFSEWAIITTLPRGGQLQIAQPQKFNEQMLKEYHRDFYAEDKLTWQCIFTGRAASTADVWKDPMENRFVRDFLRPNGFHYAAAAPLRSPVLEGYPGVVHVYRKQEQGPFTAADMSKLTALGKQLDAAIDKTRAARPVTATCAVDMALTPRPKVRTFLFDGQLRELYARTEFETLDARLREQMMEYAKQDLSKLDGELVSNERLRIPDSRGDIWTFRVVSYRSYPALGQGPFVFFCMQPRCGEWGVVKPADVQADPELARLIPAIKFMKTEWRRGCNLFEIAKVAHLSPFHFHRRFTELLGLTPKHYMLECQIQDAKVALLARKKELAQIAADCGFAHQSHFTSRFKQATGLTPTRWRRVATAVKQSAMASA